MLRNSVLLIALGNAILCSCNGACGADPLTQDYSNPANAINASHQYAWELFCALNQVDPKKPSNVIWESWIEQDFIFEDPTKEPIWDKDGRNRTPVFHANLLVALEEKGIHGDRFGAPAPFTADAIQTVRVNRVGFDYIIEKHLWYQEGVLQAAMMDDIHFPIATKIVKTTWLPIQEADKPRFHWQTYKDSKGQEKLVGLVAMGIVTKDLPMWYWSTFEHIDNPGRCDVTGTYDTFGVKPAYQRPNRLQNQGYPKGELRPQLLKLFADNKVPEVWKNYRLNGTQVSFVDEMGRPTILGNSIQEAGQITTSSCMTCHARAAVAPGVKVEMPPKPGPVPNQSMEPFKTLKPALGYAGIPDQDWFFQRYSGRHELQLLYPVDFLWELVFLPKVREGFKPAAPVTASPTDASLE